MSEIDQRVAAILKHESYPLRQSEVAEYVKITPAKAKGALQRLEKAGQAFKNGAGFWQLADKQY